MRPSRALYSAFVVSGVAGLVYEVLWTRYLSLYVGHSAYAEVLVLAVYLGGMAIGSLFVADLSERVSKPLVWYGGAEVVLALFGFAFHLIFRGASALSYDVVFPALGSAGLVGAARWGVAGLMILPQAIVLGATFPLMAASVVRADATHPGRGVASVYVLNTLGGAVGVLVAGFWMIGALGLPGTSVGAGVLNLVAAGLVLGFARRHPAGQPVASAEPAERVGPGALGSDSEPTPAGAWASRPRKLSWLLLTASFGTALASFAYEIGWLRMLALVLGSATHAFELMLSAFIFGLAGGALWIRRRADASENPLRLLGAVQVFMGVAALASLPLFYLVSFDTMSWLVRTLPGKTGGYALFNLSRYGLCLLVMLPSTVLAGMTLPLITGSLLRAGIGERAIGAVYGVNTVGSVIGAGLAGLVALPMLGLKGLILAGAAVDVALGLLVLERSARWVGRGSRPALIATLGSAAAFAAVGWGLHLDNVVMGSGVFRNGEIPGKGDRIDLFYADGRTATVSAYIGAGDGVVVLATNGKPDASIGPRWLAERRDTLPDRPIDRGRDFTTEILAPSVALAYRPDARNVANIGHGSGITGTTLLTSKSVERLVTLEIEPMMVEGSLVFLPANAPAISDPRSSYVFDDAKSYFAYRPERFDIIFSEPSNPWVSGTSSLFTEEFYRRIRGSLSDGGVLTQWMHLYELDDDLFLSVVSALDKVFPSYRAYLVGDMDVAIVARADGPLGDPDWSVLDSPRFRQMTRGAPAFKPEHMESLLLFDEKTLRPLLDRGIAPNSDYHPILDLGAERTRFRHTQALGIYSLATTRVDLVRELDEESTDPIPYDPVPSYGLDAAVLWERGAWLREALANGGGIAPKAFPQWQNALVNLQNFLVLCRQDTRSVPWQTWAVAFDAVEEQLHWGTSGWVDSTFYRAAYDFLDRQDAPAPVRAAVDLRHAFSLHDWPRAADAADVLVSRVAGGESWVRSGILLDIAVLAYLHTSRPAAARTTLNRLGPHSGRVPSNARTHLLEALVEQAEAEGAY